MTGVVVSMDEKLLQMTREAGIVDNDCGWPESTEYGMVTWNELARFAELVAAKEREACAEVADWNMMQRSMSDTSDARSYSCDVGKAIRARGKQEKV